MSLLKMHSNSCSYISYVFYLLLPCFMEIVIAAYRLAKYLCVRNAYKYAHLAETDMQINIICVIWLR